MENSTSAPQDSAQEILSAIRQIQDSPALQSEAKTNPDGMLNRLKLSGIARHAVALAIAGGIVATPHLGSIVTPDGFWAS